MIGEIQYYRESLADYLAAVDGITVLGTAGTASEARALLEHDREVVVLLDVSRPSDVGAVGRLHAAAPSARVIALGLAELEPEVLAYAEEGIVGFVGRNRSLDDLVHMIRSAVRGELDCSPLLSAALLRHVGRLAAEKRRAPGGTRLTPREHEIVQLIERGLSNKEIARELHIELPTVKNHVHNVLEKLHVTTRGQAAALLRTLPPTI